MYGVATDLLNAFIEVTDYYTACCFVVVVVVVVQAYNVTLPKSIQKQIYQPNVITPAIISDQI